jgi:arylsulfatase A-like enzyme
MEVGAEFNTLAEKEITLAEELRRYRYATAAFTGGGTLHPALGFGQGFDRYDASLLKLGDANMAPVFRWLEDHRDNRFFLFWHTFEVHAPYLKADFLDGLLPPEAAGELRERLQTFERDIIRAARSISAEDAVNRTFESLLREFGAWRNDVCEALYCGAVRSADDWVGRLLSHLRRLGLYDRTMIVLLSDHGEEFAEREDRHFYNRHGHTLYEEIVRAPLIIKLPGRQHAGMRVSTVVQSIDLMPTVLDVLRLEPSSRTMQGRSLRPLWEQPDVTPGPIAVTESLSDVREKKGVRDQRYKLICTVSPFTVLTEGRAHVPDEFYQRELYDLAADPREAVNLLEAPNDSEPGRIAAGLEQRLRETLTSRRGQPATAKLDQDAIDSLRALGYIK